MLESGTWIDMRGELAGFFYLLLSADQHFFNSWCLAAFRKVRPEGEVRFVLGPSPPVCCFLDTHNIQIPAGLGPADPQPRYDLISEIDNLPLFLFP